ncbi:MAG: 4Fe-4S binding protein [Arcobacter sp.]|jgi:ferredoxin|uniref:4Fe-4S binding protein n=1 Tax=Arcobacter sp. TaxID=1872629 RepID=UPI002A23948C|nr:4Fe-4S binding protein [Arcobacter sp.]MDD2974857.1 4Fe-4S binding protein [Aliarcobacter cryaerophilus]MDX9814762.1 4Fe-4S binding protein [Sulfurimonadaceae bacterium]MDY3205761.1 4Fe-4S binding protein [Arcobacter sp.]
MTNFINRDKNDIFKYRIFSFLFKNNKFLIFFRILVTLLFFYAIFYGFYYADETNKFTTTIFWGIFWSLFMVTTLASFGRIFCGICPHGFMGKIITKIGLKKTMPSWMQNRYIGLMLLVVGWWAVYYFFEDFWKEPFNTALMFFILTILSFVIYYVYKDMSYCKYICPIGTLTRAYDKISFTKLETYQEHCRDCRTFDCATACPYDLKPFTFEKKNQTDDCTLCMQCAQVCESVKFKLTKPAEQLNSKLKVLNVEIWSYILILACIPMSMTFAHGLNRSKISDEFIWNKVANYFGLADFSSGFGFLFALIITIFFSIVGLYLSSKILKKDFNTVFTTLGIAFIPLFIFSSLGHTWEMFFVKDYKNIVEGFASGFGIVLDVNSLSKRNDGLIHYFALFKWIGIIWALILMYKRLKLIQSTTIRKIFAYIFASSAIIFFIFITFYRDYIFKKYGVNSNKNHSMHIQIAPEERLKKSIQIEELASNQAFYFSHINPSIANRFSKNEHNSHVGGKPSDKIPSKKVYLVFGDINNKKSFKIDNIEVFYINSFKKDENLTLFENSYSFSVPNNGYYNLYAINKKDNFYKVAKLEYLHGKHGTDDIYSEKVKDEIIQNRTKIDLIRIKLADENSFFHKIKMGEELKFKAFFEGKPLTNAKIKINLQSGWIKELQTNENGEFTFNLVRDYFPKDNAINKRFKQEFIITLEYNKDDTNYILTYPSYYYLNDNYYMSYEYGLILIFLTLLFSGVIVYRFRKNRTVAFKETKYV